MLLPTTLTRSCVHRMIAATIDTFTWELIVFYVVESILLTTFPAHFTPSTIILTVAIFLAFVTSQWIGYVLLDPLHCIANFYLLFKYTIYAFVSIVFPSFLIDTFFTSVTPCSFSSHFYFFDDT